MPGYAQSAGPADFNADSASAAVSIDRFYVSPLGSDTWSGQSPVPSAGSFSGGEFSGGPFQTLTHAAETLTALSAAGLTRPVEVSVEPSVCAPQEFLARWFPAPPRTPVIWHADPTRTVLIYTPGAAQQNEALAAEDYAAGGAPIARFYVASFGSDSWRGRAPVEDGDNGPFRTVAHAQEMVGAFLSDNPGRPVEVVFAAAPAPKATLTFAHAARAPRAAAAPAARRSAGRASGWGTQSGLPVRKAPIGLSAAPSSKLVFAHYMVCNRNYGGSVAGYERDIQEAKASGIDGFALNCGSWNSAFYKQDTAAIFQAARAVAPDGSFKLFFSADMTGLHFDEVVDMMTAYASHPNYWRVLQTSGRVTTQRPVLSTWSGESVSFDHTKTEWTNSVISPLRKSGINIYFMPFFFTRDANSFQIVADTPQAAVTQVSGLMKGLADGMFYSPAVVCPVDGAKPVFAGPEAYAAALKKNGLGTMGGIAPQYWGSKQLSLGRRYIEYFGGEGMTAQWNSVINVQKPDWVECFTWNDFDEATYLSPIDDVNKYWPYLAHSARGFYKSHAGAAKLNQYFINWYKSGRQPVPASDSLVAMYRTHPKNAVAPSDKVGPINWFIGDCQDTLFVTTILTAPATLAVTSGSQTTTYSVPAGLQNTRIPFRPGAQSFQIVRAGKTVLSQAGDPITATPAEYNFNYYTVAASN